MLPNELAMNNAVTFKKAYDVLYEQFHIAELQVDTDSQVVTNDIALLFVPLIVNGTFACELFLKSLLPQETGESCEHDLKKLYTSPDMKQNIKDGIANCVVTIMQNFKHDYDARQFHTDIKKNKDNYDNWRYFHENKKESIKADFLFIHYLMQVLFDICLTERGTK